MKQFGYGRLPNVITSLEFERFSHASGPTGGKILLKNGQMPASIAISALHRKPRYELQRVLLACLLHVLNEDGTPGSREDRRQEYTNSTLTYEHSAKDTKNSTSDCSKRRRFSYAERQLKSLMSHRLRPRRGKLIVVAEDTLLGVVRRDTCRHGCPQRGS